MTGQLVTISGIKLMVGEDVRYDSRSMAAYLDLQHKGVFQTIKDYQADFAALGVVRFQTDKPLAGSKGGRPERYALLNEDQCFLLLTFSRNTDRVRELKVRLVQAFGECRKRKEVQKTEYLPTYHTLHDEIHRLAAGSNNERFVHMNVNKAINKAIGIGAGERKAMDLPHQSLAVVAQMVVTKAMAASNDHHDGYQNAKAALESLHTVLIGKDAA